MGAVLDLRLGLLGVLVRVQRGLFPDGLEAQRRGRQVEESLLDRVEGALREDVDAVDYIVDKRLRLERMGALAIESVHSSYMIKDEQLLTTGG